MELRHLRYFVTVATEGTFSAAAEKLRVSQPALSKQVRDLEEEIGVSLFSRTSTGVRLTAAGREFYAQSKNTLATLDTAVQRTRAAKYEQSGTLRIGIYGAIISHVLPHVMEIYSSQYPGIDLTLHEMHHRDQYAALESGEIDVGLTAIPPGRIPPWVQHVVVAQLKFMLVMREEHRLAHQPSISLADVAEETFLCFTHLQKYKDHAERLQEIFSHFGFPTPRIKTVDDFGVLYAYLKTGQGITMVPRLSPTHVAPGMVMRPTKESAPILDLSVEALWNDEYLQTSGRNFVKVVKEAARMLG